jgi:DNA-binding NtrC family response regulator
MKEVGGNGRRTVLLVDDEHRARSMYGSLLEEDGRPVLLAGDGREARETLEKEGGIGLVILDLRLPDVKELELFRWIRRQLPALPVVILTGYASVETAVQALREGAFHYLTKPPEVELWRSVVRAALQRSDLEEEIARLRRRLRAAPGEGELVGRSRPMLDVYQWIRTVGPSHSAVLIRGESGTGKELAARALHASSQRSSGPFIGINCGALPPQLLESELFGYEKGAFTGAVRTKAGLFEAAHGGSIFLDEVGECSPELQVRLLRVLQEKEFQRVGGTGQRRSDFRMIAASNRSLEEEVQEGRFREDLYYRVNVISFTLPPLREKKDDIPLLAAYFLEQYALREGKKIGGVAEDALELLMEHDWPGNVRELENVIERGVVVSVGDRLSVADLPPPMQRHRKALPETTDLLEGSRTLAEIEKLVMTATMERHEGNKSQVARVLGISRKLLYSKMREYGL